MLTQAERVFAEAAPFVVVRFVVGSDVFLAVCDVLFWGSSSPSCMPSRTGLRLDTLGIVWRLMLMCLNVSLGVARLSRCDVLDSMEQKNLFRWGVQFKKSELGTVDSLAGHGSQVKMADIC